MVTGCRSWTPCSRCPCSDCQGVVSVCRHVFVPSALIRLRTWREPSRAPVSRRSIPVWKWWWPVALNFMVRGCKIAESTWQCVVRVRQGRVVWCCSHGYLTKTGLLVRKGKRRYPTSNPSTRGRGNLTLTSYFEGLVFSHDFTQDRFTKGEVTLHSSCFSRQDIYS